MLFVPAEHVPGQARLPRVPQLPRWASHRWQAGAAFQYKISRLNGAIDKFEAHVEDLASQPADTIAQVRAVAAEALPAATARPPAA